LRQWAGLKGENLPGEDEGTTTINGHIADISNAGALLPESHTALYGDRIPDMSSRSRSSSMDGEDGEEIAPRPSTFIEEALRSFSLADRSSTSTGDTSLVEVIEPNSLPTASEGLSATSTFDFPLPTSPPYSSKTLQSLVMRYEPPSPFSKWDTPLFTIPACDPMPPVSAIWDALFPAQSASTTRKGGVSELKAEVKPHAATVLPHATGADALQVLERITADVVTQIITGAKECPELTDEGGDVEVNFADTRATLSIPPGTILSLPMLQRLRRRFTQIQRGGISHGRGYVKGEKAVGETFVRFLNGEMGAS
jgi:tRNA uridine 5-carbamoylmethylation protein Kti12